jgi:hypothetical protein
MNHWQMIALAYALTFVAIALEVALLFRRRGNAWRQARAWLDAEEAPAATVSGGGSGVHAGAGAAS